MASRTTGKSKELAHLRPKDERHRRVSDQRRKRFEFLSTHPSPSSWNSSRRRAPPGAAGCASSIAIYGRPVPPAQAGTRPIVGAEGNIPDQGCRHPSPGMHGSLRWDVQTVDEGRRDPCVGMCGSLMKDVPIPRQGCAERCLGMARSLGGVAIARSANEISASSSLRARGCTAAQRCHGLFINHFAIAILAARAPATAQHPGGVVGWLRALVFGTDM